MLIGLFRSSGRKKGEINRNLYRFCCCNSKAECIHNKRKDPLDARFSTREKPAGIEPNKTKTFTSFFRKSMTTTSMPRAGKKIEKMAGKSRCCVYKRGWQGEGHGSIP
jgi:hypothetical protein